MWNAVRIRRDIPSSLKALAVALKALGTKAAGLTAVAAQPITGVLLAWQMGYSLWDGWIALSIALYLFTGAFWLPVVWMQMRMRDLATAAAREARPLPAEYHRLFRLWFAFGFPAFGAVLVIFWLMLARPQLG